MADTLNQPFNAIEVQWTTPVDIAAEGQAKWSRIRVYRSSSENSGYGLINEMDSYVSGSWVTFYHDNGKNMQSKDSFYYLVRYYNPPNFLESKFYLTFKTPSPR